MNEPDDPLWTGADGDAELRALTARLRPLAHGGRPLPLDALPPQRAIARPRRLLPRRVAFAAAAAAVLLGAWFWWPAPPLAPGASPRAFAAVTGPVRIELGALAELTLLPGSRLRFEHWRPDEALFRLEAGALQARVAPPPAVVPGFFRVATPQGRVVDQGCRYELTIDEDGSSVVRVTEGAVTFEFPKRTVFVPAGASVRVSAAGPALPLFHDADVELRKAAARYTSLRAQGLGAAWPDAAKELAALCRRDRDSLVLWHLLGEPDDAVRAIAERALIDLVGPPEPFQKDRLDHFPEQTWLAFLRTGAWSQAR